MPNTPLQQAAIVAVMLGVVATFAGITAYMVVFATDAELTSLLVGALATGFGAIIARFFGSQG